MGDFSFVASGLGNADWLWSCSHGAGRSAAAGRAPHEAGIRVGHLAVRDPARRAQDRGAPQEYKPIGPVLEAQEQAGLIRSVARLRPWVTFKA